MASPKVLSSTTDRSRRWSATFATPCRRARRSLKGGHRPERAGRFFQPTILTGATAEMAVAREETFGPVAPLFRFETEADAIRWQTLPSSAWPLTSTAGISGVSGASPKRSNTGWSGINTGLISTEVAPFGGMKESGIGREGSRYGLEEFLEVKYLCIGGI